MSTFYVSPVSEEAGLRRPGRKIACSTALGWRSLLVQTYEQPGFVERYETLASPDVLIVAVQQGEYTLEHLSAGTWHKATYRPGVAGTTAPMVSDCLRWHSSGKGLSCVVRAYVPQAFFDEAAEEFRKPGSGQRASLQDLLAFSDPVVAATMNALAAAANAGLPDMYAETAGRFLATHLLSRSLGWINSEAAWGFSSELNDRRLRRTLEFMTQHLAKPLTIEQLAREAGISRFHFCRLFKQRVGVSPHQYLQQLRMQHAKVLLKDTEQSIAEIVTACGYSHAGHFAAAFLKTTGQRPSHFRRRR